MHVIKYNSLYDSIKQNGDRHKANAEKYLVEGKLSYAAGSLRKAARNYERAMLHAGVQFTGVELFMNVFCQKVANDIAKNIIEGI